MSGPDSSFDDRVRWEPSNLRGVDRLSFGQQAPQELAVLADLAPEITDEQIEASKPGNRGLMLEELRGILNRCRAGTEDFPGDPRWDELRLRTLDRLAKLTRAYEPQAPRDREGDVDRVRLAARIHADIEFLESKMRGDE